ncbi:MULTISPECIES: nucleotide sugar dehydrogenase [unclassified Prochlorococcus]|uniref:nucleotide sugar dehydrogenase n=1 Tax=unclassified Prochlorococcus TaxID=2627481 RepID=UPI0005338592|nr:MULTISPECIES: nucleotide sugar dehydrogenase [unclassified Prochlorococcus]KGG16356.1 UDP-glucose dehydrogenase [Prochlorococcus sp. MIT 0603]KGG17910.1 UDP-glucose dehydrogenase [Prochlorococcus sp. MIT 0602]
MSIQIKEICCIGAGYVGGPTMAVIAHHCPHININVVDLNEKRIKDWNDSDLSRLPIFEPGLRELIIKSRGINLHFSTQIEEKLRFADMIFISVNTPTKTKGIGAGQASDLKWVEASARQISRYAKDKAIVVEKSTLPVRTAQTIKQILEAPKRDLINDTSKLKSFFVLSNPEFLSEGTAINDLENPDRVLIGGEDNEAINSLIEIYLNWVDKEKILTTNLWSSELSKLISNAFLAQRISSINSFSALCEATGADIRDVSLAIGADKRIGKYFLNSGPGFGGSCFKKDLLNLVYICNHYGLYEVSSYWQKVVDINNWQRKRIAKIIIEKLFGTITGKNIAIFGFAFKANTNDTRESSAISICKELIEEGANLCIYDPKVSKNQIEKDLELDENNRDSSTNQEGSWSFCESIVEAANDADAIVILTEWREFKQINWELLSNVLREPAWLFDTRSIANTKQAKEFGINVWELGNGV